jgi:hypothetical protein
MNNPVTHGSHHDSLCMEPTIESVFFSMGLQIFLTSICRNRLENPFYQKTREEPDKKLMWHRRLQNSTSMLGFYGSQSKVKNLYGTEDCKTQPPCWGFTEAKAK